MGSEAGEEASKCAGDGTGRQEDRPKQHRFCGGLMMTEDNNQIEVRVEFYGSVVGVVGKKNVELLLSRDTTVGDFIDTLNAAVGNRLGELLYGYGLSLLIEGKSLDRNDPKIRLLELDQDTAEVTVCLLPVISGGS